MNGPHCQIIYLTIEPGGSLVVYPRPRTAQQLMQKLDFPAETALVIRDGKLLTPDRQILAGETIRVRLTGSRG